MKIEQAPLSTTSADDGRLYSTGGNRALILHTQRLSTEDGPGIRTTVFFKGCPLNCSWCHNPESIPFRPQLHWMEVRCIGCGICIRSCPHGYLEKGPGGIARDRPSCKACGRCAAECPAGAQEMLGRDIGLEELLAELLKDKVYYEKSGGGVTLSGGEPLMQPVFSANLLRRLQESGVSTALDTCGLCPRSALDQALAHTDLVLFDLKETDAEKHRRWTGQDNRKILENLLYTRDFMIAHPGKSLWIRTPLIPGATANRDSIERTGRFIRDNLGGLVQRWELCAFNNLCRDKYRRLDMDWEYGSTPLMSKQEMSDCEKIARVAGSDPGIIFVTGAARAES